MMAAQFRDLKFGDRFYFENGACETIFTPAQVDEIRKFTLASLICTCTDTESIQSRVTILLLNVSAAQSETIIVNN